MNSMKQLEYKQCRACYNSNKNLQLLTSFSESCIENAEPKTYDQLLLGVCNINIMQDEPLGQWPQFICLDCCEKLKSAYDFIQQTLKINHYLQSIAGLWKCKNETGFIQKPELDIPLEVKAEKDDDMEVLPNERVFQYSPIEFDAIKEQSTVLTYNKLDYNSYNNYANEFYTIKNKNENDDDGIKEIIVPSTIEFVSNDLIFCEGINKLYSENTENSINSTKSKEIPYCIQCNKSFSFKWSLTRHNRNVHKSNENQTPCTKCTKKCSCIQQLNSDSKRVHHKIKKALPKINKIKNNKKKAKLKICKNIAVLACNECKKIFNNYTQLSRHKRFVHIPEEEKIVCYVCGYKFGRKDHYKRHLSTVHGTQKLSPHKRRLKMQR